MSKDNNSNSNKLLDNTEISHKDVEELETATEEEGTEPARKKGGGSNRSRSRSSSSGGSKKKSDSSADNSKNSTLGTGAGKLNTGKLKNIRIKLSNKKAQDEFIATVAELVAQYAERKLDDDEIHSLESAIKESVVEKALGIKTLD